MGDTPLMISFGPIVDRMFIVALSLIIFVYGTTAVMWVYNEIEKLLNRFWKIEPEKLSEVENELVSFDPPPVLYQVMWSEEMEYGYLSTVRIRIVADPMDGAAALIKENGAGYIRYRVWISDPEPWGLAKWYGDLDYRLPKFPEDYDLSTFSSTEGATFTRTEKPDEDAASN